MLNKQNMRASLAGMPLDVLDPTLPTLWDSYASLPIDRVRRIDLLLKESWVTLKRPWL